KLFPSRSPCRYNLVGNLGFNYDLEKVNFEKTFTVFSRTLGDKIFSGTNPGGTLISRFLTYHYEAFCIAIQPFLNRIDENNVQTLEKLKIVFMDIKQDDEFRKITTGGGKNYSGPLNERIGFVSKKIEGIL
ncbi:MAG: hypothetical protein WDZ91_09750, partial [Paenibacillaceae bacterium]